MRFNEISVCPYCPRYRNCEYSPCVVLYTVPIDERKEIAYSCLTDVRAESFYESLRDSIDSYGVSIPSIPGGSHPAETYAADFDFLDDLPF